MRVVLASGSIFRAKLLELAGFEYEVRVPNVDETLLTGKRHNGILSFVIFLFLSWLTGWAAGRMTAGSGMNPLRGIFSFRCFSRIFVIR